LRSLKGLTAELVAADGLDIGLDIGLDDGLDDGVIKAGFDLDNGFGAEQCFVESNYGLVALRGLYSGFRALFSSFFKFCFRVFFQNRLFKPCGWRLTAQLLVC
jgi:hypothetical protein